MARKKLSEFKAKSLILPALDITYSGVKMSTDSPIEALSASKSYVVKVDQGIKKRFKLGLIELDKKASEIKESLATLSGKGYSSFLVEEYVSHEPGQERFLSLERTREGFIALASKKGGVDIESNKDEIESFLLPKALSELSTYLGVKTDLISKILGAMDDLHISFLEINPLVVIGDTTHFLDMAIEVDDAGLFFVDNAWTEEDFVDQTGNKTKEESAIEELSKNSQASFRLVVLNKEGSIFMLLSGGGASIVLADEVYNTGLGKELANYGEYSGNPNAEETYLYTKEILSLLLSSKSTDKKLIVAGGVANFTDIRITFKGIIKAIDEVKDALQKENIRVFVRRGGPFEKEGLKMMEDYLKKENLLGFVSGPDLPLTDIVHKAIGGEK